MPVAEISVISGRTAEQSRALLTAVRQGVLEGLSVKPDALSVWLREFPADHVLVPEGAGSRWMVIRISCFTGRDTATLRGLFAILAEKLSEADEDPGQCVMIVADDPLENWGIYGGKSAAEVLRGAGQ